MIYSKNIQKGLLIVAIAFLTFNPASSQKVFDDIHKSFRTANTELLASHFSNRIKLSILSKEYDPSKSQARVIINEFFNNHPPTGFEVKFESEKKNSHFIIGLMKTEKKNYRISIYFRIIESENKIHFLKIEEENENLF